MKGGYFVEGEQASSGLVTPFSFSCLFSEPEGIQEIQDWVRNPFMLDNYGEAWVQIPFCFFSAMGSWTSHSILLNISFLTGTLWVMIHISQVAVRLSAQRIPRASHGACSVEGPEEMLISFLTQSAPCTLKYARSCWGGCKVCISWGT